jgi:alpha-mannosidase
VSGAHGIEPFLKLDNRAVVVEAVKPAEDGSGDVIVRLYEAHGTRARARLAVGFGWTRVAETDLLERPIEDDAVNHRLAGKVSLELRPFQLVTLRFGGVTAAPETAS